MTNTLVLLIALSQQLPADARTVLERAVSVGDEAREVLDRYPQTSRPTNSLELQSALITGPLIIELQPIEYVGSFNITRTGTILRGRGAQIRAVGGPALRLVPNTDDVQIEDLSATSTGAVVILLGENTTAQTTLESTPNNIILRRVRVPTHRGKRPIEINASNWQLLDCHVADSWDTGGQDSQAFAVLNSPGPGLIDGGSYSAGSEVGLFGGDTMKIPNVIPTGFTIRRTRLYRPLSWRTDGVSRRAKSLLEFKTGDQVTVEDTTLEGCYRDAWSDCYAVVVTPRSGGATTNITFSRLIMRDITSCIQMTGRDNVTVTPARTDNIVFRDSSCEPDPGSLGGGRGILAMITMSPNRVVFENIVHTGPGNQLVYYGDSEKMGSLRFVNGLSTTGQYGFAGPQGNNGTNWNTWTDALEVTGNTFTGASTIFRNNFPTNTFVDRVAFDLLVAARGL